MLRKFGILFQLAIVALDGYHSVRVFLVNKGVEAEDLKSERFPVWATLIVRGEKRRTYGSRYIHKNSKNGKQFLPIAIMKDA